MAFPTLLDSAQSTHDNNNTTSHTVSLPSGIVSGNLCLIFFGRDGSGTVSWPSGADDGFTEIFDENNASAVGLAIAYRQCNGSEPSTIEVTTSTTQRSAHIAFLLTGHEDPATQAPEVNAKRIGTGVSPISNSLSPTGGAKDYLWLSPHGRDRNVTVTLFPSDFPDNHSSKQGTGANSAGVAVATLENNAASEQPNGYLLSASEQWVATTMAVHPAAAVAASLLPPLPVPRFFSQRKVM